MRLEFDREQMLELMKDFYILSGMKIALFDSDANELLAWPESDCAFCKAMKDCETSAHLCKSSDLSSITQCLTERRTLIYHCHAGLIEAVAPLVLGGVAVGCLMIGQATDLTDAQELEELLRRGAEANGIALSFPQAPVVKTAPQLQAAAHLMDACAGYVIRKQAVQIRHPAFAARLQSFLQEHLSEDIPISSLTRQMGMSKSRLYQICEAEFGMGAAAYLRFLRIQRAKELLVGTSKPIVEIAHAVGFADYNYFCRVFRRETGSTPKKYRQMLK